MYAHLKGNHKIDEDQNARFDNIIYHREEEDKSEQDLIENGNESNRWLSNRSPWLVVFHHLYDLLGNAVISSP